MHVKWDALIKVATVSFAVTVAVAVVFAIGVVNEALARQQELRGETGALNPRSAAAGLSFGACAAVITYGLYLIIPQFN